jgi:hypothetical protein
MGSSPMYKDLSFPQVILVEFMWIHRLHEYSTDSMDFFLAVKTLKFGFQSMDCPYESKQN